MPIHPREPRTYTTRGGEVREVPVIVKPIRGAGPGGESVTRRVTRRNNEEFAAGRHPATLRALDPNPDHRCGNCVHHHVYPYHTRTYHKCDQHRLGRTHSSASDIRIKWQACTAWAPEQKAE